MNQPVVLLLLTLGSWYAGKLWLDDWRAARDGRGHRGPLPGATPAPASVTLIGVAGALVLVGLETAGEYALGVSSEQSRMTWLFALYAITAAPFMEELIFRGWLVVETRGPIAMWGAVVAASLAFALMHPFLWRWDEDGFAVTLTTKGWFSSVVIFATSLWFYLVRLARWNPRRSLLPCIVAHAAKNVAVVAVKSATGFMSGLW